MVERRLARSARAASGTSRPPVVPISLFRPGSHLHRALVCYKSGRDASARAVLARDVAELVAHFLSRHSSCLARASGGGWDRIDVVPSTRRGAATHPLLRALDAVPLLAGRRAELLSRAGAPLDHLSPDPDGFTARTPGRRGCRVLLLDDIFTTGARALSAVHALQRSGAEVVAVVPIGRLVHTDDARTTRWWAQTFHARSTEEWTESPCCLG